MMNFKTAVKNSKFYLFLLILFGTAIILQSGCKSDETDPCSNDAAVALESNICFLIEHPGLSVQQTEVIESLITDGVSKINKLMPMSDLLIRIVDDPNRVIPEIGLGGFNPNEYEVIIGVNANFANLDQTLQTDLVAQLAHEMHHARRRRTVGYGSTLFEAIVTEGLADHFSIEVTGIAPPPWSVALTGNELQDWIQTASNSWDQSPYNHSAWFVGTDPSIPRWAGYAIGFELVKNYLAENPGKMPSDLFGEPANSFRP